MSFAKVYKSNGLARTRLRITKKIFANKNVHFLARNCNASDVIVTCHNAHDDATFPNTSITRLSRNEIGPIRSRCALSTKLGNLSKIGQHMFRNRVSRGNIVKPSHREKVRSEKFDLCSREKFRAQ